LGHELVGIVEELGPGVSQDLAGQACGVLPARFCGACSACRKGLPELCARFECLGNTHDGGYAEAAIVRVEQLRPLDGLAPEAAVWLEPLACVLRALKLAGQGSKGPLLVVGAGVLGRLMALAGAAYPFSRIGIVDPNPEKVEAALACGAQAGWTVPRTGRTNALEAELQRWAPEGPTAVVDTSGAPDTVERAVRWAAPGGRIILFGVADPDSRVYLSPAAFFAKELSLLAAAGMTPASFDQAEVWLRSGRIDPTGLVAATIGLEALPELLLGRAPRYKGKVLVRPDGAQA
jgi:threonine dehydrogenase-like Zn-dependent dehydrogenase